MIRFVKDQHDLPAVTGERIPLRNLKFFKSSHSLLNAFIIPMTQETDEVETAKSKQNIQT